jgi:hypothetical protein
MKRFSRIKYLEKLGLELQKGKSIIDYGSIEQLKKEDRINIVI